MTENLELQHNESVNLKKNTIQGLYSAKDCYESYWSLKARIDLATFQDKTKEKPE